MVTTLKLLTAIVLWITVGLANAKVEYAIGVLAYRGYEQTHVQWDDHARYLSQVVPGAKFRITPLDLEGMSSAVRDRTVDFILTNPGHYVILESGYGISRLLTLKNLRHGKSLTQFGSVLFSRSASGITDLTHLAGRKFAAVNPHAFGGYQLIWRELNESGFDPATDFASIDFLGFPQKQIVQSVLNEEVDVGTVRTGVLERMFESGELSPDQITLLNPEQYPDFPFLVSTRLYPEWPFAKLSHTGPDISQKVAISLLSMVAGDPALEAANIDGWTIPLDYGSVHDLFKTLHLGPYQKPTSFTIADIWSRFSNWIVIIALIITGMLIATILVSGLNRRLLATQTQLELHQQELESTVSKRTEQLKLANSELIDSERALRRLYDITSNPNVNFVDRLERVLALGCSRFNANLGLFVAISEDGSFVKKVTSPTKTDLESHLLFSEESLVQLMTGELVEKIIYCTITSSGIKPGDPDSAVQQDTNLVLIVLVNDQYPLTLAGFEFQDHAPPHLREVDKDILNLMAQWIVHELEQSRVDDDLTVKRAQLARASRLNTLGEVAATVVHDLSQPLTAISNYVSGLKKAVIVDQDVKSEVNAVLQKLDEQAVRAGKIIQRLDNIINPTDDSATNVDLSRCIQNALIPLSDILDQKNIQVSCQISNTPIVYANSTQLEQVFLNVIQNAIDALVTARIDDRSIRIECIQTDSDFLKVTIANSGKPLDQSMVAEVFNPYFSTKDDGMGLGLPICRTIMESLGGAIEVSSTFPETGFSLIFPMGNHHKLSSNRAEKNERI